MCLNGRVFWINGAGGVGLGNINGGCFLTNKNGGCCDDEDTTEGNSTWATGDWNGDGDFNSSDFVVSFTDGGYEMGPLPAASAVPEPTGFVGTFFSLMLIACWRRRRE